MGTVSFTLRLDEELKKQLEQEAARQDRSAGYLAAHAISDMLNGVSEKRKLIDQALAEAEKGEFISEEKMTAWFLSLGTGKEIDEPDPDVFLDKTGS